MDSRQNFNVGQEVLSSDLVNIAGRIERGFLDYILLNLVGGKQNAFFKDSFKVTYLSSNAATIGAGLGLQNLVTTAAEPENKPLYLNAAEVIQFDAADGSNDRIDIICVKANLVDGSTETRKFKDASTQVISDQNFVINKVWEADIQVVAGTPAASPVAPPTPAGYLRIASVLVHQNTGINDQADITDERSLFPFIVNSSETGSSEYDAIVGNVAEAGVEYSNLKSALDIAQSGWKILVKESETINTTPEIIANDVEIVFKPNVTLTKGLATVGILVSGDRAKITGCRFFGFSVAGDKAIQVDGEYCSLFRNIFNNCATETEDNSVKGLSEVASITE